MQDNAVKYTDNELELKSLVVEDERSPHRTYVGKGQMEPSNFGLDIEENATAVALLNRSNSFEVDFEAKIKNITSDIDESKSQSDGDSVYSERETWNHSAEFVLSLLGYTVGLGNVWRFPYLCMRNGGGAFLIPFIVCLVFIGLPMLFLEVSLGQFIGRSSLHAWEVCPLFKGIGAGMMIAVVFYALFYNMILAWTLYYIGNSFLATLPWSICTGWWNTDSCFIRNKTSINNMENGTTYSLLNISVNSGSNFSNAIIPDLNISKTSPEEEFWQHNVLQLSSGFGDFGVLPPHLALCFFGAWVIVFLCILKGVRSIGKVVYVTALLPYVLLTAILIRGLTLDGAIDGIIFYLKPDLEKMKTANIWVEAAIQVFFSLGPGFGPLITMSSYNKFKNNSLRDAYLVCFIGEGTSIFCGFVVFTILGFVSHELQLPIEDVVKSGPGLGFVVYPQALSRLPFPQIWAVLFFTMLLAMGLDTQFSAVENIISGALESFPRLRKRRVLVSLAMCMAGFVIAIPQCFQGGMYIFQLIDWYVAILAVPLFGLLECLIFGWIYGTERFCRDLKLMLDRDVPVFMRICWCVITPAALVMILASSLATYSPPSYGDYIYPAGGQVLGWIVACLPLVPVIVFATKQLMTNPNQPFMQRLKNSLKPSNDWKPNSLEYQKTYISCRYSYSGQTRLQRIKTNILGN